MDCLHHKGTVQLIIYSVRWVLAVVIETSIKILDWLVLKNECADSFQLWVVDCTQLEHARSVIKEAASRVHAASSWPCDCMLCKSSTVKQI